MNIVLTVAFDDEETSIFLNKIKFPRIVTGVLEGPGFPDILLPAALGRGLVPRPMAGLVAPDFTALPHAPDSTLDVETAC